MNPAGYAINSPSKELQRSETRQISAEPHGTFDGNDITVRVYLSPKILPSRHEKISLKINNGDRIDLGSLSFPKGAVVAVLGKDQNNPVIKDALGHYIIVSEYKKGLTILITRYEPSELRKWTFKDAQGNPIPNANVQIYMHDQSTNDPGILLDECTADNAGQLEELRVRQDWQYASFVVSHPDYGTAWFGGLAGRLRRNGGGEDVILPVVPAGSDADLTSASGVVVGPDNEPLSGIKINCSEIRTLDEGLFMPLGGGNSYAVLTDTNGQFRIYVPADEQYKEQRGEFIPPKSKYFLHIQMPPNSEYRSYDGWAYNDKNNVIKLEKKDVSEFTEEFESPKEGNYHTFSFVDETGEAFSPEEQKDIVLYIHQSNKPKLKLAYGDWVNGRVFPNGLYDASIRKYQKTKRMEVEYKFKIIELQQNSPADIIFELSNPISYQGQIIHGITGEPLEGVFVMAMWGTAERNISWLTQEQWDLLHTLHANPDVDDPALKPIHDLYSFKMIQRSDSNGKFVFTALPEDKIWGCVVFDENFLPFKLDTINGINNMKEEIEVFDFGQINLFPSGKIKIEAIVPDKHISIEPAWRVDFEKSPEWARNIKNTEVRWLEENEIDSFYVPAGVTFHLTFRIPYDDQWAPLKIDREFFLDPGEVVDLGKQYLQSSIWIFVKVIDPNDEPVEGVPIRLGQDVPHITDIDGRAKFYVPTHSKGKVGIMYYGHDNGKNLRKQIEYFVAGNDDVGKEYVIKVSEKELKILFD
jgi:hypothetical protein